MPEIADIIAAIEQTAPLSLQEQWDNCGLQVGRVHVPCTGVMVCVDVTDRVIDAAVSSGCNLIVSHHPLIFRPVRQVGADSLLYKAIVAGVTVYSAHTSLDNAPHGVSHAMARQIGVDVERVLAPLAAHPDCGTGVVGLLSQPITQAEFVDRLKQAFALDFIRCSAFCPDRMISRVALVGGAGGSFISDAVKAGADAVVTGDIRHHDFVDHEHEIFMADITHFDSEKYAKEMILQIISEKFPNFAALIAGPDTNPINYL